MVTARELTQTLRARSAERRAKAEVRAERLRAQLPKAASMLVTHYQARRVVLFGSLANGTTTSRAMSILLSRVCRRRCISTPWPI